jgi:hypothetical protein
MSERYWDVSTTTGDERQVIHRGDENAKYAVCTDATSEGDVLVRERTETTTRCRTLAGPPRLRRHGRRDDNREGRRGEGHRDRLRTLPARTGGREEASVSLHRYNAG